MAGKAGKMVLEGLAEAVRHARGEAVSGLVLHHVPQAVNVAAVMIQPPHAAQVQLSQDQHRAEQGCGPGVDGHARQRAILEVTMSRTIAAEFETRRDAEMTVEHLVQEHGMDPKAISVVSATVENSAGTKVAGSDNESGQDKGGSDPHPAMAGKLRVSVEADDAMTDKVLSSFSTYGGKRVA